MGPSSRLAYLVLDLDNAVWNKQQLDSRSYERVSQDVFHRTLSMLTHPVTGEADTEFAKHSNHEIWRYKLKQLLASGQSLCDYTGGSPKEVTSVDNIDISTLVECLGPAALCELETSPDPSALVQLYLPPSSVASLRPFTSAIGVASSGARALQDHLLQQRGYYHPTAGIHPGLCTFSDEGTTKQDLIERSLEKYLTLYGTLPVALIYVGDSEKDMAAVRALKQKYVGQLQCKAAGVLTGFSTGRELVEHGADILLDSLADPQSLKTLIGLLQE